MPTFIYAGQSNSLRIAGRTLLRGRPTVLEGRAAESAVAFAAKHSELHVIDDEPKAKAKDAPSSNALAERQALVARAKELGIPAKGKSADLAEAIAAAEAAQG